ncbi:LysR family transcriptional regulator [Neptunicoccus cionae]|uniref:LysR family transcriptional regulator n=1 Tax=Neptunicoccus cionae TaxID=2035344 RepID=UPI000C7606A7|nr:LysR family transcriptional regulator [Amylibacter cionae]PLS21515.1 LysR family transcriptional regulator [Amylibacter cionae]
MTIALFKTLIAISEHGSFSAAAEEICVTHAAVGQQMKRLEDSLNVSLFDRSAKTPRLNQLGKALVPKAKAVVAEYETILDDLTGDPRMIGELVLGAVPSTIRGLIPQAMKRLVQLYPDLHIRVVPDLSPNLLEQIERGTLDAAVLSEPTRLSRNLDWKPFVREELVLLTSPEVTENDPLEILAMKPYIRHTRQASVGMLAEEWLSDNKVTVHDAMEMGSLENLASMIAHDLGVSIGPNICVPDPIFEGLRKISLGPTATARTLGILTRTDCSKIRLVQRLYDQIHATIEDNHPGRAL